MPSEQLDLPARDITKAIDHTVQEALGPVVREALTEEVMQAIKSLVGLTPKAVEAIEQDLSSENDFIRQGAYRLLARYTLGHPALVPEMESDKQVVVLVNGVARPSGPVQPGEDLALPAGDDPDSGTPAPTRICDTCDERKPEAEFVGASHRCQDCFIRARDHAHRIGQGKS